MATQDMLSFGGRMHARSPPVTGSLSSERQSQQVQAQAQEHLLDWPPRLCLALEAGCMHATHL